MEKKATVALFMTALIWGIGFVAVDAALQQGWETFPLLCMRGFIGGGILFLISFHKKWWKNKKTIFLGIGSGTLFFIGFSFQTIGQDLSNTSNAAFLTSLNVIFIPLISRFLFKKEIQPKIYLACVIALIGTAILSFQTSFSLQIGDILLIIGALGFSFQIIFNEKCGEHNDPISITCIQLLTMGVLSLISMPISSQTTIPTIGWESVLFLAVLSSALACILQLYGQAHVAPSKACLILVLESVFGTIGAILLLGDAVTLSTIIGGLLLISAVVIVEVDIPIPISIVNKALDKEID